MNISLCFNDFTLTPVPHQNKLWIRAAELARALGYGRENQVSRLYRSNADEFTLDMTQVIEISDGPVSGLTATTRIFSLRGCHLLAMFARTPIAKAFRKWVLDVLDKLAAEEQAALPEVPHFTITPSTTASRKPLRSLVNAWARISGQHQETLWPQVKAHFQLERIDDLPEEWMPDAIAWVQGRIDALPKALPAPKPLKAPSPTLRAATITPEASRLIEQAEQELRTLHAEFSERRGRIVDLLLEACDCCIPFGWGSTALHTVLRNIVGEAAAYPGEQILSFAMPRQWLEQIIPAMIGKGA